MPAFYLLVFIGVVAVWFLLSFAYKPIGRLFYRIWKDSRDAMMEENKNKENVNEERK